MGSTPIRTPVPFFTIIKLGAKGSLGFQLRHQITFAPTWICREPPEPITGFATCTSGVAFARPKLSGSKVIPNGSIRKIRVVRHIEYLAAKLQLDAFP